MMHGSWRILRSWRRPSWLIAALFGLFFASSAAQALVWELDPTKCSARSDPACVAGFDARATFNFSNATAGSIDVDITLENRTRFASGVTSNAPLAAFGFSVFPGLNNDADGVDDGAFARDNLPAGWRLHTNSRRGFNVGFLPPAGPNRAEVCLSVGRSCFGTRGTSANSVDPGESVSFRLALDNVRNLSVPEYEVAFAQDNPIFFRFKPLRGDFANPGSLKFGGIAGTTTGTVPEPGALALFGFGLAGLILVRRRRNTAEGAP